MNRARPWTEAEICQSLDGTLTRIADDNEIIVDRVPPDFIPSHKPPAGGVRRGTTSANYSHWTENEDTILLELRRRRMPLWRMAEVIGRSDEGCSHRIRYLEGRK